MTIYAIVNNLLDNPDNCNRKNPIWTIISSAAILQGGNPYFVPDFAAHFEARLALAIKIGKLGKGISPRFTERYVESVAPSIIFLATDLLESLKKDGLPWTPAISYDKCLAIGNFSAVSFDELTRCEVCLSLSSPTGTTVQKWGQDESDRWLKIEEIIASLSRDNTLKTGDIVLIGVSGRGPEITTEMRAHLSLNGKESFNFNIR